MKINCVIKRLKRFFFKTFEQVVQALLSSLHSLHNISMYYKSAVLFIFFKTNVTTLPYYIIVMIFAHKLYFFADHQYSN